MLTIAFMVTTWWLIPLSKWVITPVINGISRVNPLITGVITHLLSGMTHQVWRDLFFFNGNIIWIQATFFFSFFNGKSSCIQNHVANWIPRNSEYRNCIQKFFHWIFFHEVCDRFFPWNSGYTFEPNEALPVWFLEDEDKYNKPLGQRRMWIVMVPSGLPTNYRFGKSTMALPDLC